MPFLFWDASALAKRYALEVGSDAVDELFTHVPAHMMMTTPLGYAETYAVLVRKLNEGRLDLPTFSVSATALQDEVIDSADFALLAVDDAAILAGVPLIRAHNLNSADATILSVWLRYLQTQSRTGPTCVLVAADHRLIRASLAESLTVLNPETIAAADVAQLLATL